MAMVDRDVRGALTSWRRAAELGSTNAYVLVQAARTKLLEIGRVFDPDQRLRAADVVELREWLDRGVQLSPHYHDAWEMLALVEAQASDMRNNVINEVQQQVKKMKEPGGTLLALAVIRWRAGDPDTANEILKSLVDSPKERRDLKSMAQALQRRFAKDGRGASRPSPTASPPAEVARRADVAASEDRVGEARRIAGSETAGQDSGANAPVATSASSSVRPPSALETHHTTNRATASAGVASPDRGGRAGRKRRRAAAPRQRSGRAHRRSPQSRRRPHRPPISERRPSIPKITSSLASPARRRSVS